MPHVLLVEDEPDLASFVERGLREEGYEVTWVARARDALDRASAVPFDLVLLDLRLPDGNGLDVCRELRSRSDTLPILMITALDAVDDRVVGLRSGADDYLPKPFAFAELLARAEALLRRARPTRRAETLRDGDLVLDLRAHLCMVQGHVVDLTPREFDLLAFFLQHAGEAVSRDELHRDVWRMDFDRGTNLINVYVNYVRSKLRDAGCSATIETVRGVGYRYLPCVQGETP